MDVYAFLSFSCAFLGGNLVVTFESSDHVVNVLGTVR